MAFLIDNAWYVNFGNGSNTGYYSVPTWVTGSAVAGQIVRQATTPAVGSERVFVCIIAGALGAGEPVWVVTRGAVTVDNAATWMEATGVSALNGDTTNSAVSANVRSVALSIGQVIYDSITGSVQICTTAGTTGVASPAFSATAGVTTADNLATWTSLGLASTFTAWMTPHARLASAFADNWGEAGNSFFVGDNHAETQATAIAATCNCRINGTIQVNARFFVYCVDRTVAPPGPSNLKTTATITTTGASGITISGGNSGQIGYLYGLQFFVGTGNVTASFTTGANLTLTLDTCAVSLVSTGVSSRVNAPGSSGTAQWINTTVSFGSVSQLWTCNGPLRWKNTPLAIQGATLPTTLFGVCDSSITLDGVDLSALTAGKNIFTPAGNTRGNQIFIKDCKLSSTAGIAATFAASTFLLSQVYIVRSDSAATNYRNEQYNVLGTETAEITITRSGGASDGTTSFARKVVTLATPSWPTPFELLPIVIWNPTITGNVIVTVKGTWNVATVPNNDQVWLEVSYLGSALTPIASFANNTKATNLSTATPLAADTSTWAGGGSGVGWSPFQLTATLAPRQAGYIYCTVKVGAASKTVYIDPMAALS